MTRSLEQQLEANYGLSNPHCKRLNTPVNDVVKITTPSGQFALKLYSPLARTRREVEWEVELVQHLMSHGAPVARLLPGRSGYLETITDRGEERVAALFEWAPGEKPGPTPDTYVLLGKAAARIHQAVNSFHPSWMRDDYNAAVLIDQQLERMRKLLTQAGQWDRMLELAKRLKRLIADPNLERGICHMDHTLDNVHRQGDTLTVFDFDSAGKCWRALEPYGVFRFSKPSFDAWLEGYRTIRPFSPADERAVAAFGIIGDLRVVAWKLGVARSSRGNALLNVEDVPGIVDGWLEWEASHVVSA